MTDTAEMEAKGRRREALVFDFELEAPPEKVWRALTIPAYLERWLKPGAAITAEVVEADAPRHLRWRWCEAGAEPDLVSVTLAPRADGGTALHLVHERRIVALRLPTPANSNSALAMAA